MHAFVAGKGDNAQKPMRRLRLLYTVETTDAALGHRQAGSSGN